jgi:hypothetical protein
VLVAPIAVAPIKLSATAVFARVRMMLFLLFGLPVSEFFARFFGKHTLAELNAA